MLNHSKPTLNHSKPILNHSESILNHSASILKHSESILKAQELEFSMQHLWSCWYLPLRTYMLHDLASCKASIRAELRHLVTPLERFTTLQQAFYFPTHLSSSHLLLKLFDPSYLGCHMDLSHESITKCMFMFHKE